MTKNTNDSAYAAIEQLGRYLNVPEPDEWDSSTEKIVALQEENALTWAALDALCPLLSVRWIQDALHVLCAQKAVREGKAPTLAQLDTLWSLLGDIPLNYNKDGNGRVSIPGVEGSEKWECLDEDFFIWLRGVHRDDVWHWFDDQYAANGTCLGDRWFAEKRVKH